ncbi:unnamed protein product [Brassica oleracea]
MIDFSAVFGNSRFESRYNDGDTLWVDGSGRLREGKMGIVRRCQWDSISKKGFKGFGWILEIMEIKTWAVRLRLCRLAQTNFVKIRSYQDFKRRRRCIKGEERRRFISSPFNKAIPFLLFSSWWSSLRFSLI